MSIQPRHKVFLAFACGILLLHAGVAMFAKPSFRLTIFGDALPCGLLIVAILAVRENFRFHRGVLPLYWKLMAAGLFQMLLSQAYWFYYDSLRVYSSPSPVIGDTLFLLAHVFFLSAFVLRPHSASAGRDMRLRHLDFALLTFWWLALYAYFALPWQLVIQDFSKYNPAYYLLALIQHLMIITGLAVVWKRSSGLWRTFYGSFLCLFVLIASANLLLSVAIDRGVYYAGGFYDTPFLVSLLLVTVVAAFGPSLQPGEDKTPNREINQSLWTARIAMVAILSLPVIALLGSFEKDIPEDVAAFRLRLVFGAMVLLSGLVFWKLTLLARELRRLVRLSQASLENLKSVQSRVTHSQKLAALGRLAAGATHEISNPLTAILGYSELLTDIPSLSPPDRESALTIQKQVHCAQAAVNSLRNSLRNPDALNSTSTGERGDS
ncbi:MAG TPA: histidine kinase dimerization/phospho-acceptor domain-containing protein [Candidatus Acidoferrales bacterium]|jgi:signal transduction histidine kinase|nr:histidine kinase dimerization/phospho-acceptor domain-containing protein [Candidatus Acidoferrales bacterium]